MIIYLGADHRGYGLKEFLKKFLNKQGYISVDLGNYIYYKNDDYPDFAAKVAGKISKSPKDRGIVICGSGVGVDVVANKFKRARSVLGFSPAQVKAARSDDDVNILSLSADFGGKDEAVKLVKAFLKTPFKKNLRFKRRLRKISKIEGV
jgi:ribose 5-phosphate isomerase B